MCIIDEKQEAIARIRMAINADQQARHSLNKDRLDDEAEVQMGSKGAPSSDKSSWRFGSPEGRKIKLRVLAEDTGKNDAAYTSLENQFWHEIVLKQFPEAATHMAFDDEIYVSILLI